MKLPRVLTQRPAPRMPELVGFEPRFDAIPTPRVHQPAEVVRPLYWWAKDLRTNGDILVDARFDAATMAGDGDGAAGLLPGRRGGAPPR